jgi:hypothetical protein
MTIVERWTRYCMMAQCRGCGEPLFYDRDAAQAFVQHAPKHDSCRHMARSSRPRIENFLPQKKPDVLSANAWEQGRDFKKQQKAKTSQQKATRVTADLFD